MSGPYGRDEKEPGEDIDHPIIEHKTPGVLASELREEEDEDEPSFTEWVTEKVNSMPIVQKGFSAYDKVSRVSESAISYFVSTLFVFTTTAMLVAGPPWMMSAPLKPEDAEQAKQQHQQQQK